MEDGKNMCIPLKHLFRSLLHSSECLDVTCVVTNQPESHPSASVLISQGSTDCASQIDRLPKVHVTL